MRLTRVYFQFVSIQTKKYICAKKGDSLIAVNEGMIHDQRLKQCRTHFSQILIVPGLRSVKRTFQETRISNAGLTTESLYQYCMDFKQFVMG